MPPYLLEKLYKTLRWSEQYTRTDMVYLARSGFWINLGSVTISLFSLVLYIIFARALSPEVYGTYQYLLSAGAFIGAFSLTGMNNAVIRAVALGHEGVFRRSVRLQLLWGAIPFGISLCVALYYAIQGNSLLALGFLIIAFFTPINNALNTYAAFLIGKKDFRRGFFYGFFINLFFYSALSLAAITAPLVLVLIGVNLATQAIGLWIAYRSTIARYHPGDSTDESTMRYGTHLSVMGVISTLAIQGDNLLAFHFLGPAPLAVYAFATAIPDRIGSLLKFIPSSLLPQLSQKTPAEVRSAVAWRNLLWVVALALAGVGIYALLAEPLFTLLFPAYEESVPYSQIYAFAILAILANIFSTALIAQRRVRALYVSNTVVPIIQLILQFIGIVFWGLWGLVIAKLLGSAVLIIFTATLVFLPNAAEATPAP